MYDDSVSRADRTAILSEQQGHRCCYCGVRFSDQMPNDIRLYFDPRPSVEHMMRLADGGERTWLNEVAACRGCNSARGPMPPEDFYALVSSSNIETIRAALRKNPMRRTRTDRHAEVLSRHVKTVGAKWPPNIGELPMTAARQAYFDMVYGPWANTDPAVPKLKVFKSAEPEVRRETRLRSSRSTG